MVAYTFEMYINKSYNYKKYDSSSSMGICSVNLSNILNNNYLRGLIIHTNQDFAVYIQSKLTRIS